MLTDDPMPDDSTHFVPFWEHADAAGDCRAVCGVRIPMARHTALPSCAHCEQYFHMHDSSSVFPLSLSSLPLPQTSGSHLSSIPLLLPSFAYVSIQLH